MADPYVSVAEYVATFGERETILITNTVESGPASTYDSVKVEEALADSSAEVESYAAKRYVTPFSATPPLLKGWVKGLARYKLYLNTGRMNQAVKDAADGIYAQLKLLASGAINLPIDEIGGEAPAQTGIGYAQSSCDRIRPVLSGNPRLAAFTEPFTGYRDTPRWRDNAGD